MITVKVLFLDCGTGYPEIKTLEAPTDEKMGDAIEAAADGRDWMSLSDDAIKQLIIDCANNL